MTTITTVAITSTAATLASDAVRTWSGENNNNKNNNKLIASKNALDKSYLVTIQY